MYKILGEDKVMVDKLAPERLEAEYSLVSSWTSSTAENASGESLARRGALCCAVRTVLFCLKLR
jgi:hypothetical protein